MRVVFLRFSVGRSFVFNSGLLAVRLRNGYRTSCASSSPWARLPLFSINVRTGNVQHTAHRTEHSDKQQAAVHRTQQHSRPSFFVRYHPTPSPPIDLLQLVRRTYDHATPPRTYDVRARRRRRNFKDRNRETKKHSRHLLLLRREPCATR